MRCRIYEIIEEGGGYYTIIADEVTDRFTNKEILLVCLRFLKLIDGEVCILDSVYIAGRATGVTIGQYILDMLKKHNIDLDNCRGQAYDGATAMSSALEV